MLCYANSLSNEIMNNYFSLFLLKIKKKNIRLFKKKKCVFSFTNWNSYSQLAFDTFKQKLQPRLTGPHSTDFLYSWVLRQKQNFWGHTTNFQSDWGPGIGLGSFWSATRMLPACWCVWGHCSAETPILGAFLSLRKAKNKTNQQIIFSLKNMLKVSIKYLKILFQYF